MTPDEYPYRYRALRAGSQVLHDRACRIVEYYRNDSVLLEFDDGSRVTTPRIAIILRKAYTREQIAPEKANG